MKRNVYDFDQTVYSGDSTLHFYRYCARRHPGILLDLPVVGVWFAGMALGVVDKTRVKQRLYRFLTRVPDVDALIASFWDAHRCNLKRWYLDQKRVDDVIISASPEFLLRPVCEWLGVTLLASRVDVRTGRYTGLNCHGKEKVARLYAAIPGMEIARFYSDSLSDAPLAQLAQQAYLVKGEELLPWPKK